MSEDTSETTNTQQRESIFPSRIKDFYRPIWEQAAQILGKRIGKEHPEFINARKEIARTMLEMKLESRTDQLTGLFNETGFNEVLKQMTPKLRNSGIQSSIGYLDVNGLKKVNDESGHEAGDNLIKRVADIIKKELRGSDLLARLHGDEFAFLLPQTSPNQSREAWNRILNELEKENISIAIGLVPLDLEHPFRSLEQADKAMYEAKQKEKREDGKTQIEIKENLESEKEAA